MAGDSLTEYLTSSSQGMITVLYSYISVVSRAPSVPFCVFQTSFRTDLLRTPSAPDNSSL